ncbi:WUSCHEL-related homeobox 8-like [Silene latifolia]|uniref:WUSCHEL-related homeobox 8-like n=1 Tax=Silene latifolia TaxID=37657 RepID=UPI003D78095A
MASSNKHWPSMFKSKPCNNQQWSHHKSSILSNSCGRSSGTPLLFDIGCEERTPDPKPRWNPKPEQIRILEAIFNSGLVNPPRDEIRRIRTQLQEYGNVGDANVFYWFQNRKSRSKHKQRALQAKTVTTTTTTTTISDYFDKCTLLYVFIPDVCMGISRSIPNVDFAYNVGIGEAGESTVFINGMAIGVPNASINVKEEFGEGVMLVHTSTGHAVVTDECGVTLHPLQHGASYHLVHITHVVSSPLHHKHDTVHDDFLASEFPYQI